MRSGRLASCGRAWQVPQSLDRELSMRPIRNARKKQRTDQQEIRIRFKPAWVAATAILIIGMGGLIAWLVARADRSTRQVPPPKAVSLETVSLRPFTGPLPPLPDDPAPVRPPEVMKAAYEFAGRHPEILSRIPCFCGCGKQGHRSNHDCFVAARAADGSVTWTAHGMRCGMCVDIASEAMTISGAGRTLAEIRKVIEQRYAAKASQRTDTPVVPGS